MRVNSRVILILLRLPAVSEVVDISHQGAIWFGEVVAWVSVVVAAQAAHLVVVGAEGDKDDEKAGLRDEEGR